MLRRSKGIAIVLAFLFCMSFLAPSLIAPQAAEAAVTYDVLKAPTVSNDADKEQNLGTVKVSIPDIRVLDATYAEYLTITLPSGVEFTANSSTGLLSDLTGTGLSIANPGSLAGDDSVTLEIKAVAGFSGDKDQSFLINFNSMKVKSGSGDIEVSFSSPGSVFASGKAIIGKRGDGSTSARVNSVKAIGDAGGTIDDVVIEENMAGVLQQGQYIKLRLPNGFSWYTTGATVTGGWGLDGHTGIVLGTPDGRDLKVEFGTGFVASQKTAGKVTIKDLKINVDDVAKVGEIEVNVSGSSGSDVTDEDIVMAKYGDFGVRLAEKEVKEITAGLDGQAIGSFYIEEDLAGSLVKDRAIYMELPSGVKWDKLPTVKVEDGTSNVIATSPFEVVSNSSSKKVKATIDNASTDAVKLLIEKGEVYVQPGFEGDVELQISGSAGVEGTVKVAKAVKGVEFTAENVPDVVIGQQSQKVADMLIKENAKAAIQEKKDIVIQLDTGFKFAKEPKVEVIEGNLEIDDVDINSDDQLVITIDSESTKPSTIKISDVYVTGLRYAPEGSVIATLVEAEGNGDKASGSTALDTLYGKSDNKCTDKAAADQEYSEKSAGEAVIAKCVTPAETSGTATFKINSNIYTLNGVSKVMDVAPYIKNSRTYMPVRYVAYALGMSDNDIVWDAAAQKVTLTKGDTVVEMTIGSTTITVNGEAKVMDVAPEISNSRTMLPARFVAEAFGAVVGWDAATSTVVID